MTKNLTLEYVCTGNSGRSPMAEAIAKDYVQRQGLVDKVKVVSSGTNHHQMFVSQRDDPSKLFTLVKMGLQNDIFRGRIKSHAEDVVQHNQNQGYLDECIKYLVRAEGIYRDMALLEVGLIADGKYHQPTVAHHILGSEQWVILPMAGPNADQVQRIYAGSVRPHVLTPLNEYAGMSGDVPNPFCQLLPAYQQCRDHLMVAVPKTVDRAVAELL